MITFFYRMNAQMQFLDVTEEIYNQPADTDWVDYKFKGYVLEDLSDIILTEIYMSPVRLSRRIQLESTIKSTLNYLTNQYQVQLQAEE